MTRPLLTCLVVLAALTALACGDRAPRDPAYRVVSRLVTSDLTAGAAVEASPTPPLYQTLRRQDTYALTATMPAAEGPAEVQWTPGAVSQGRLRFGYSVDATAPGAGRITVEVRVRRPAGPDERLFTSTSAAALLTDRVQTQDIPLPDLDADARLILAASTASDAPIAGLVVHWVDPVVSAPADDRRPNIMIVMVDTLRTDQLQAFGGPTPVMPNLDRRLPAAARFTRAYANASWTLPSVASLMTGLYPGLHGAGRRRALGPAGAETDYDIRAVEGGFELDIRAERYHFMMLSHAVPTLAGLLARQGYRTGAVHDNGYLNPATGVLRGMDTMREIGLADAYANSEAAIAWLREHHDSEFLFFLHYIDPHQWPEGFDPELIARPDYEVGAEDRRRIEARYDDLSRRADDQIERVLQEVTRLGLDDDTIVVFLADHAERFFAAGVVGSHGGTHRDDVLHVPLALWGPGVPSGEFGTRVSLVDVLPTVLEMLDLSGDDLALSGDSLLPIIEGRRTEDRDVVAEFVLWPQQTDEQTALFRGPWKYIHFPNRTGADALYRAGPGDVPDVANALADEPGVATDLRERLLRHLDISRAQAERLTYTPAPMDDATLRSLRALGYIR